MKQRFCHRAIFWTVLLAFGLMLTGKAIACLAPSAMEMGQGKSMDCCMERCRMETTHEAAKKACEQSLQAFSLLDTLSSPDKICDHSAEIIFADFSPLSLFYTPLLKPINHIKQVRIEDILLRHYPSVRIYTSLQIFFI